MTAWGFKWLFIWKVGLGLVDVLVALWLGRMLCMKWSGVKTSVRRASWWIIERGVVRYSERAV